MSRLLALRLLSGILLIVGCVIAVEAAGAMLFFWQRGYLVYLKRDVPEVAAQQTAGRYTQRLHPYFGFTGPYNLRNADLATNDLGFIQRETFAIPYLPSEKEFVVFVFGGSVAARSVYGREGGMPLVDALNALPEFSGRRVVVINMAQGAGKQPQQLLELAYLLAIGQHIDLALNIDGFNEFALGWQNLGAGLDPVLPPAQSMWALAEELYPTPDGVDYYRVAYAMSSAKKSVDYHGQRADVTRSGILYVWHTALGLRNQTVLATATTEYQSLITSDRLSSAKSKLSLDLPPIKGDPVAYLYDLWLKCSQQMRVLALSNGFKYLHLIQPNQYYTKHVFSEHERQIALALPPDHDYVRGVTHGYPLLAERSPALAKMKIVSMIGMFDDVKDEIYFDPCCHFNAHGETLFAQAVAREVAKGLSNQ
jgi:hypothetical protein